MRSKNLILFTISLIVLTSVVVYSADAAGIPKKAISTVARFLESDLPTTTVFTDHASTYTAGKQTFAASSSSSAGVNIPTGSDPSSPVQGDIWLNSDTLKYFGTSTHSLLTSAITSINSDTNAAQTIQGVSGNTTASTSAGTTTINTGSNVVVTGGSAQTISKQLTINSGVLGGNLNVGSNALTTSGHLVTLPTNTGTVLLTNGSGSSLSGIVTSITGTANNLTSSASTGAVTLNLGSNVVTTGGSTQTISKGLTLSSGASVKGLTLSNTAVTGPYTVLPTDDIITVTTNTNPNKVTLPTASSSNTGKIYYIKKTDTTTNILEIISNTASQTIDGFSSYNLTNNKDIAVVQSEGSNYVVLNAPAASQYSFHAKGSTPNDYYGTWASPGTVTANTFVVAATTSITAYPFIVGSTTTFDQAQIILGTAGAGTSCNVAIYRDNGNVYPGILIAFKNIATTGTGTLSGAFATPPVLYPGLYWIGYQCSSTTPKIAVITNSALPNVMGAANGLATFNSGYVVTGSAFSTTSMSNPYPSGGTTITAATVPIIGLRASG